MPSVTRNRLTGRINEVIDAITEDILDAQADLQVGLGQYRLKYGSAGRGVRSDDSIEDNLAKSLARLHTLLEELGRPMYQIATHPDV